MAEGLRNTVTQTTAEIAPGLGNLSASSQGGLPEGLLPYLSDLGLDSAHLAKVLSLVQATEVEAQTPMASPVTPEAPAGRPGQNSPCTPTGVIRLCVAEEQSILENAYRSFFSNEPSIAFLGTTHDTSMESLVAMVEEHQPQVLLVGVKALKAEVVEMLKMVKDRAPEVAIVLLFAFYDAKGIKALRGYSQGSSQGRAYLLKHTIDTVEQLNQVVCSVAQGRIIVDPIVMEALVSTGDTRNGYLRDLSPKALEVLSWMAKGYRNDTIADVLSRDVKTIERHINNIYSTLLETDDETTHPRVRAALMYLKATGLLSTDQLIEE